MSARICERTRLCAYSIFGKTIHQKKSLTRAQHTISSKPETGRLEVSIVQHITSYLCHYQLYTNKIPPSTRAVCECEVNIVCSSLMMLPLLLRWTVVRAILQPLTLLVSHIFCNGGEYIYLLCVLRILVRKLGLGRTASAATQASCQNDSSVSFSVISTRSVIGRGNNHSQHMWRGAVGASNIYLTTSIYSTT